MQALLQHDNYTEATDRVRARKKRPAQFQARVGRDVVSLGVKRAPGRARNPLRSTRCAPAHASAPRLWRALFSMAKVSHDVR